MKTREEILKEIRLIKKQLNPSNSVEQTFRDAYIAALEWVLTDSEVNP